MAKIFPFQALRYNPSKVSPAEVVTQPYDKITPAMQDRYYAASPYNLVRIILGKPQAGDNEQQNVYTPRRCFLAAMARQKAFWRPTPNPAFISTPRLSRSPATLRRDRWSAAASSPWAKWRTTTRRWSSATSRRSASPRRTGSTCCGPPRRILARSSCCTAIPRRRSTPLCGRAARRRLKCATNTTCCTGCGRSPTRPSFRRCRRRWPTRS